MEKIFLIIRKMIARLIRYMLDHPVAALSAIGAASLLAYIIFAILPLFLPDTDPTNFPPYLALPEGDFSLANYYYLYVLLTVVAAMIFALYLSGLGITGQGVDSGPGTINEDAALGRNHRRTTLLVFGFAVAFHLVMLTVPTLLSTDIFDYIRHGRIFSVYGENPLIVPATYFPDDPFFKLGGWLSTGSVYGPLHVYVTGFLTWIAGDGFSANFLIFRFFFGAMNIVNLVLIWKIASRIKPGLEHRALFFYGWNPLILIIVVSNAHNDILMLTLMLAGFLLYLNKRYLLGVFAITLAVLLKFIALPILLVYAALVVRRQETRQNRILMAAASLIIFACSSFLGYLPLWAGRETFKYMAAVGQKANYTLPGLLRDAAAGHLQISFSATIVQLSLAAMLSAYAIWHIRGVRNFRGLVSASAGLAFLTPLALFWFQPWYLTMSLGLIALRPWRILYRASLVFSFSVIFFDSFWWHTPVSINIEKPMRVLVVFGPPILYLLIAEARNILPVMWKKTSAWAMESSDGEEVAADPSRMRMFIEVVALAAAAIVPMAAIISTSPQLRSIFNLLVLKLQLLLNV